MCVSACVLVCGHDCVWICIFVCACLCVYSVRHDYVNVRAYMRVNMLAFACVFAISAT